MLNIKKLSFTVLFVLFTLNVQAASYDFDNFHLNWDTVFAAGVQFRIEKQNKRTSQGSNGLDGSLDSLSGVLNNAYVLNSNDGNNSFDQWKPTVERISFLSEADFNFGDWGVFVRGKFWHDFRFGQKTDMTAQKWAEYNSNPVFGPSNGESSSYGHFTPGAQAYGESGQKLLDFFWYGKFHLFDHEFSLKIGRQVISWGEAMLSGGGIGMATSRVDAHIRNQPGFEIKELFLPDASILLQTSITDTIDLSAYYKFEWHPAYIDASGSYFSEMDSIGAGGNNFAYVSGTEKQILGKYLDFNDPFLNQYGVKRGHLDDCLKDSNCKNSWQNFWGNNSALMNYSKSLDGLLKFLPTTCDQSSSPTELSMCRGLAPYRVRVDEPSSQGQFGINLKFFLESGAELGFYYVNYHETIPNFIMPIDSISGMAPVIDILLRVADSGCYKNGGGGNNDFASGGCGAALANRGGFKGIQDLDNQLSLKQINALLLFLSALPADQGTVGEIAYNLTKHPEKIFGDDPGFLHNMTQAIAKDPLLSAVAAAASIAGVNFILKPFGMNADTVVRSINYRIQYADNVHLLGMSYSTVLGTANVATEVSYRLNTPVMLGDVQRTPERVGLLNWHVNMLQVFEPRSIGKMKLWDFATLVAEAVAWYIPDKRKFPGYYSTDSKYLAVQNSPAGLGLSAFMNLEYHSVFNGWDINVPLYFAWGAYGAMFNNGYRDGQATFATGVAFKHMSGMEIGLGLTTFFGETDDIFQIMTQDRDNMTVYFKYSF